MSDDPFDIPDVPDPSGRGGGDGGSGAGGHRRWPWFLAGLALGVAAALLVPRYVAPYLPAPFRAGELRVQGPVLAEQREEDRLLLTVETEQGAMLATFRRQVPEISLLVDEGDTVTLGVREYRPFVEDPTLVGVWKGRRSPGDTLEAPADTADADTPSEEPPARTDGDTGTEARQAPGGGAAGDTAEGDATDP